MLNDLTPEELELSALGSLLGPADIRYAVGEGVDEYSFQVDKHVKVWEYLVARSNLTDIISREDVALICDVELPRGLTDKETLVEALVQMSLSRRAAKAVQDRFTDEVIDNPTEKTKEALAGLVGDLSALAAQTKGTHIGYYAADAFERLAEVKNRAAKVEEGGMVGLMTGLDVFDKVNDGWQAGDLVAVIGALNVGKSFFILWSAANAWYYSGAKVLFISPESKRFDVEARLDAIVGRFNDTDISNKAIRRGTIDFDVYEKHIEMLDARKGNDFIIVDSDSTGGFSVNDIIALAREHRPDLLVIDGFHLVHIAGKGGEGAKSWEKIKDAADSIKTAAQALNMAVIAGSQATRNAVMAPSDAPELGESAYGMGLVEAANRVISLAARRENKQQRVFKIQKNRDDEVPRDSFYLHFAVDIGDIRQVYPHEADNGVYEWVN